MSSTHKFIATSVVVITFFFILWLGTLYIGFGTGFFKNDNSFDRNLTNQQLVKLQNLEHRIVNILK